MTIRPIDLQVLIPRVTEVGKAQQIANHQNELQQQQFAEQMKQIAAGRRQQVQRKPAGAGGRVEEKDAEEESKNRREREKKKRTGKQPAGDEASSDGKDPVRGHHIDIKF